MHLLRESQATSEQKSNSTERELLQEKLQGQQQTDFIKRIRRKLLLVTKVSGLALSSFFSGRFVCEERFELRQN